MRNTPDNTRMWHRGVTTTYHYDSGGRQLAIEYSDSTPDVLLSIDVLGRITHETQGALLIDNGVYSIPNPVHSIGHTHDSSTLRPSSETHNFGALTRNIVRGFDALSRPQIVAAGIDSDQVPTTLQNTEHFTEYFYGDDGRLLGIDAKDLPSLAGRDYGIEYAYTNNSASLVHSVTRAGAGTAANLVSTNAWDPSRNSLLQKENQLDGAPQPVSHFTYTVNDIGQRDTLVTAGTAFGGVDRGWTWGYDDYGQVTSATNAADADLDRSYEYDAIGNRIESSVGDSSPATTTYSPNALNQYSAINPGTTANPVHDLDGNLTEDGAFNQDDQDRQYIWDAENRLMAVNQITARDGSGEISATTPLVAYAYDSRSRRISRTDMTEGVTTWYLYDGWNVIAEYEGATPALTRTHTWGMDLAGASGSLQGAGGVGGLLVVRLHGGDHPGNYYPTYDANGNISEYLTDEGVLKAHYEYDPFGNDVTPVAAKGDLHGHFTYRFSTKPFDEVSGWYYYGYRYYDPVTGRWPSRDPIEEEGGINLYGFVGNNVLGMIDVLGSFPHQAVMINEGGGYPFSNFAPQETAPSNFHPNPPSFNVSDTINSIGSVASSLIGLTEKFLDVLGKADKISGGEGLPGAPGHLDDLVDIAPPIEIIRKARELDRQWRDCIMKYGPENEKCRCIEERYLKYVEMSEKYPK